jgi:probable HAF family extracellular repeat protein
MKKGNCCFFAALVVASTLLTPLSAWAGAPAIYNLGALGVPISSNGYAISNDGWVSGASVSSGSNNSILTHAFLYVGTPGNGGAMADLGTLGGANSYAYGVNDSGQVVGESQTSGSTTPHAFLFSAPPGNGGSMIDLGTLGLESYARGINDSSQIAGYSFIGGVGYRAFLYTGAPGSGGAMQDLGTLGGKNSYAYGINPSGQIAGYSNPLGSLVDHAFRYSGAPGAGGAMADLGTLGGNSSNGYAINGAAQVAGFSQVPQGWAHAFLYTGTPGVDGHMADLGTLGGHNSYGYGVNSFGQVVGSSELAVGNSATHAILYTGVPGVNGQMIDLDAWLDANDPAEGAKWTLTEARGITDTGLITGTGVYNDGPGGLSDGQCAFLLDASALVVPEPAGFVMMGIGALGLLWWRSLNNRWARALSW